MVKRNEDGKKKKPAPAKKRSGGRHDEEDDDSSVDSRGNIRGLIEYSTETEEEEESSPVKKRSKKVPVKPKKPVKRRIPLKKRKVESEDEEEDEETVITASQWLEEVRRFAPGVPTFRLFDWADYKRICKSNGGALPNGLYVTYYEAFFKNSVDV